MMKDDAPVWEDNCSYSSSYSYSEDVNIDAAVQVEGGTSSNETTDVESQSQQGGIGAGAVFKSTARNEHPGYFVIATKKTRRLAKNHLHKVIAIFGVLFTVALVLTFAISSSRAYAGLNKQNQNHVQSPSQDDIMSSSASGYNNNKEDSLAGYYDYDTLAAPATFLDIMETSIPSQMPSAMLSTDGNFGDSVATSSSSLIQAMAAPTMQLTTAATSEDQEIISEESNNSIGLELSTGEGCWDDMSDWVCCIFSAWC